MATKKKTIPLEEQIEKIEPVEEPVEELSEGTVGEPVEEAPSVEPVAKDSTIIIAEAGDSYASLGARFAPVSSLAHSYAKKICEANGCAPIRPGSRIRIPL